MALGQTHSLTEMSCRNHFDGKGPKYDKLTSVCKLIV
jgi:hypothetical protein